MMQETMLETRLNRRDQFLPFREVRKHKNALHRDEWMAITSAYNKFITDKLLYNSVTFKLPYNLGEISIKGRKANGAILDDKGNIIRIDYAKSFRRVDGKWKYKYFLNEHSDGFTYGFRWKKGKTKNIKMYSFISTKNAKKALYNILTSPKRTIFYYNIKKN